MAGSAEREAVKQRALLALADSRRALTGEMARVSVLWHPRQFFQASLRKHPFLYIGGAAAAGFVALRLLFAPRGARVGAPASTGGRLFGLLSAVLLPVLRGPILAFAGRYLSSYLSKFVPTPPSEEPE